MLSRPTQRGFSGINKQIAVLCNSSSSDVLAGRIMNRLSDISGVSDFHYVGYGGQNMKEAGLETSEIDVDQFMDKGFYTFRKTKLMEEAQNQRFSSLNWINQHFRRNTNDILSDVDHVSFMRKLYRSRPSVVLNFDNEYATFNMMDEFSKYYKNNTVARPQRHFLGRFVKDFRQWDLKSIDYMHYSIPMLTALPDGFRFPSQYMGQYGTYDALRHIFENDAQSEHLIGENKIRLSKRHFAAETEAVVERRRAQFRQAHSISDDSTVVFFNPGNSAEEVEFSFESVRRGMKEFLLKYSAPTSLSPIAKPLDKFHTIISLQSGSAGEDKFNELIKDAEWFGEYTVVSDSNNEHYEAMAASDLGISYDGQMVSAAAALHLPTMVLLKMRMHHQWYHDLFNRWANNMNLIADKDIYPELIGGQAWFGKITNTLGEWYLKPRTRYAKIEQFEGFVKESLPRADNVQPASTQFGEISFDNESAYDEFVDPIQITAEKIWQDI